MTKMMNIGIDASRIALDQKSGTENYTLSLIEAIKKVDQENKYALYFNKLPQYFEISQTNVSTKYIPLPKFWTQIRLAAECLVHPPDVLFVPAHTLPMVHRSGLKTVVTVHDLGAEYLKQHHQFPQRLYLNWSTLYAVRFATRIIAVSKQTKKDLVQRLGADEKKIRVIYEGTDKTFFYPREESEIEKVKVTYGLNRPYMLFVGTVQPRKNLERLIKAFSKVKNKNLDLAIAGKPGWLYTDIYQAPKKYGVERRVKFLGFVETEDLPALYTGALAFVFPSLYEGFGLPLLEAMACAVPIVASREASIPEVVGKAGLLFDPYKTEEITSRLEMIASKEKLRKLLVEQGKKELARFNWEKTARETIEVLKEAYEDTGK